MKRFKEYTEEPINEANDVVNEKNDNETYFKFLTVLRDSGKTNMFGAAPYLQQVFDLSKSEARKVLAEWMKSFNESVNEAKIAFINTGLISERIQKSGLLPLLGENNVSLNKDKLDFTKELSSTLTKLYKKYSSLPVK
jgi:hypothetical protein